MVSEVVLFKGLKINICILVLFVFAISLQAQSVMLLSIEVRGNERIDRDLILATSALRIGDPFIVDNVSTALRALYTLNVFDDVNISVEEMGSGVRLIIDVVELPVIARLDYDGNKALSDSKIEELSVIKVGTYWSGIVEAENTRRLLTEYRAKGYNMADMSYRVREIDDGLDVRVNISEGKKIVVRKININGNQNIESKKILKQMKTKQKGLLRSGTFDREKYQEDLKSIIDYYQKMGFIDAHIVKYDESIEDDRNLILNIYLEEGSQFFFGSISVSGNTHFDSSALLDKFTLIENEIFDMEKFNKQLGEIAQMYYEEGYLYYKSEPQIRKVGSIVNIDVAITENTRAKIHKIHISGNTKTKEKIIRRQLSVAPGDYFRYSRVIRSQQNVYNLGFFEPDLGMEPMPINNEGDVDLYLTVSDKYSGNVNVGAGWNSRDNLVGTFALSQNNLFGNYWQAGVSVEYSKVNSNFSFDFTNPYLWDTDLLYGFNMYHTTRSWSSYNFKVQNVGGGIRLGYPIKNLDYTRINGGFSLYRKKYEVINHIGAREYYLNLEKDGWKETRTVSLTLTRDSRDNVFFPSTGTRVVIHGELAGGILGGDNDFYKQITEVSWFTPLVWSTVLRTKWRVGFIDGYGTKNSVVPPEERFYLGGIGSDGIRGYPDRSITPRVTNEEYLVGGLRSVLFSTEIGFPIASDQFVGILFLDSGNSYNKFSDVDFKKFLSGTGAGVRIRSPIGLIGFDYAYSFEDESWEPHFQFGTTF